MFINLAHNSSLRSQFLSVVLLAIIIVVFSICFKYLLSICWPLKYCICWTSSWYHSRVKWQMKMEKPQREFLNPRKPLFTKLALKEFATILNFSSFYWAKLFHLERFGLVEDVAKRSSHEPCWEGIISPQKLIIIVSLLLFPWRSWASPTQTDFFFIPLFHVFER